MKHDDGVRPDAVARDSEATTVNLKGKPKRRGRKSPPPAETAVLSAIGKSPFGDKAKRTPKGRATLTVPRAKSEKTAAAAARTKALKFRVTPEFRKSFKRAAAAEGIKKGELLERLFAEWQARRDS